MADEGLEEAHGVLIGLGASSVQGSRLGLDKVGLMFVRQNETGVQVGLVRRPAPRNKLATRKLRPEVKPEDDPGVAVSPGQGRLSSNETQIRRLRGTAGQYAYVGLRVLGGVVMRVEGMSGGTPPSYLFRAPRQKDPTDIHPGPGSLETWCGKRRGPGSLAVGETGLCSPDRHAILDRVLAVESIDHVIHRKCTW